jgi:hypothetical protein
MASPTTSTTRLGAAGDIVVPFSEIASLLQSRLSDLDLQSLLNQLLGSRTSVIQPGDLITADWAMDVVNRLAALERGDVGSVGSPLNAQAKQTLFDAFNAYSNLIARNSYLPDGTGADALSAAINITTTVQRVLMLASASAAQTDSATTDDLIGIFQRVYSAQRDLATLFSSSIPGVSNPQPRLEFAALLAATLDNNQGVTGALSLKNALTQKDANAAVLAQDRVNGVVMNESGDVVIGGITVSYRGSTRGETLVPNDAQPFGYLFRVTNSTNRALSIQLQGSFQPPRDNWSGSVSIVGGSGQILQLQPFDQSNPSNPGAQQDIQVNVVTPAGTAVGDTGVLQLRAFVPAPINVAGVAVTTLTVGNAATGAQPSRVRFTQISPVTTDGDPQNVSAAAFASLRFDFSFTTNTPPSSRNFRLRFDATDAAKMALFFVAFQDGDKPIDSQATTPTRVQTKSFPLSDSQNSSINVVFGPKTVAAGATLPLTATLEAVDDPTIADTKTFTIKQAS